MSDKNSESNGDNNLDRYVDSGNSREYLIVLGERIRNLTSYIQDTEKRRHEEIEELKLQRRNETIELRNQLKEEIISVKNELGDRVTRDRFRPVEMIAYGIATAVGTGVVFALLGLVLMTPSG